MKLAALTLLVAACVSATSPAADTITEIRFEQSCTGCAHGTTLILSRDGHATRTESGNARFGTTDSVTTGTISAADFNALAQTVIRHHFFDLNDLYGDPQIQDSPWRSISVVRSGVTKTITLRDDAVSADAAAIERAINDAAQKISVAPHQ
jgi:hypothetical protein